MTILTNTKGTHNMRGEAVKTNNSRTGGPTLRMAKSYGIPA
jgi:hypothetical protein